MEESKGVPQPTRARREPRPLPLQSARRGRGRVFATVRRRVRGRRERGGVCRIRGGASSEGQACEGGVQLYGRGLRRLGGRGCGLGGGVCGWEGAELVKSWKRHPGSLTIDGTWPDPSYPLGRPGMRSRSLLAPTSQAPGYEVAQWDKP